MQESVETGRQRDKARDPPREYEKQIQKLESDVRIHIRVEQ